jgi:two-component system nitrate/nitrite response regulator NarL
MPFHQFKPEKPSRVIAGLRDTYLRRKAAEAVILSMRERQIVRLLMIGKTNKEIAIAIKISEKTVKGYMTVLMQKLQVRNRLEVVMHRNIAMAVHPS